MACRSPCRAWAYKRRPARGFEFHGNTRGHLAQPGQAPCRSRRAWAACKSACRECTSDCNFALLSTKPSTAPRVRSPMTPNRSAAPPSSGFSGLVCLASTSSAREHPDLHGCEAAPSSRWPPDGGLSLGSAQEGLKRLRTQWLGLGQFLQGEMDKHHADQANPRGHQIVILPRPQSTHQRWPTSAAADRWRAG